MACFIRKRKS